MGEAILLSGSVLRGGRIAPFARSYRKEGNEGEKEGQKRKKASRHERPFFFYL